MTSTAEPNYWSLLGLEPDSDADALKRAFRREARRWHPDLNANDQEAEERFKLVNEAYAVLSDPKRRRAWEGGGRDTSISDDPFASGFPEFEDYLAVVLGDGPQRRPARESSDDDLHGRQEHDDRSRSSSTDWPTTTPPAPPPPVSRRLPHHGRASSSSRTGTRRARDPPPERRLGQMQKLEQTAPRALAVKTTETRSPATAAAPAPAVVCR